MPILILFAIVGLLYLAQERLYRKYWKKGLNVMIHFQDKPVLEGEKAVLTEVIENRKLLPLAYLNVKFKISRNLIFSNMENTSTSDWNYKSDIFSVLFHQRITRTLEFDCSKRGFYTIDSADAISANLLQTGNLVQTYPQQTSFYVYPREIDITALEVPYRKMMGSMAVRKFLYEDPFEFRGLRDYVQTDPMNSINWKASAKTGKLTVNTHDSTTSQEVIVFLNLEDETVWKYEQLHEMAIRICSALCYRFLKDSIPTRIITNGCDGVSGEVSVLPAGTGLRQVNAINEILARIDLELPMPACLTQVEEVLQEKHPNNPLFVMISNCMRTDLQEAFAKLCTKGSGLWLAPLYNEMEFHVTSTDAMEAVRWEVDHYAD